ncbi:MAG: HAMP domain-containing protein [Firmicutes bacterium]|nr:HAMP domain-containing protein [Dethiobacter sp.]MBS3887965.1 HAMP domain-containing protein [Bacillota bacterium]
MNHRFGHKLMLTIAILSVGGIVLAGLLASLTLEWNLRQYLRSEQEGANLRLVETLALLYEQGEPWQAIRRSAMDMAMTAGRHIRVRDSAGTIIVDALPHMMRGRHGMRWRGGQELLGEAYSYPLQVAGIQVGQVEIASLGQLGIWSYEALDFRRAVFFATVLTSIVATVVAVYAGRAFSRRLTGRLDMLTLAAERLGAGDLEARASLGGDDELTMLGATLDKLADSLAMQQALRKKLTGDISHELRTPLATMQSYLEGFRDGVLEPDTYNLEAAIEESHRLARLMKDLQDLSAREYSQKGTTLRQIELGEFLAREALVARPQFTQKALTLLCEEPKASVVVTADEELLSRIVRNLLSNAHKYTPEGGKVEISIFSAAGEAGFVVRDNGEGIASLHLPFIFERFYRVDSSRTRETGGSGIGLAIVQEAVHELGGRITVESEVGRGSAFRVAFPA